MTRRELAAALLLLTAPCLGQERKTVDLLREQAGDSASVQVGPIPSKPARLEPYSAGPEDSKVHFTAKGKLGSVEGTFTRYEIRAAIDREDFTRSRISAVLEVKSLQCKGLPDWIVHRFAKSKQYPTVTLKSVAIRATPEPGVFELDLEIDAKGQLRQQLLVVAMMPVDDDEVAVAVKFAKSEKGSGGSIDFETVLHKDAASASAPATGR
jgi:polyisoprenoid-binding protein YceI